MKVFLILFSIFISGCGCSLENIDKPPPHAYALWFKDGENELDVKKSILECGGLDPAGNLMMKNLNDYVEKEKCMERLGYINKLRGRKTVCDVYYDVPACEKDAHIPMPTVDRRLNSKYCRQKLDYDYCINNAFIPAACEKIDYANPVPECLP